MRISKLVFGSVRASALAGMFSLVTLTTFAAAPVPPFAAAPAPPALFSVLPKPAKVVLPDQALAGKSHAVKINRGQLRSGRFTVGLPGGISYEAVREFQHDMGGGRSSWVGHAKNAPENSIVIGISGTAVAGTFSYNGKLFKLEPRANGSHVVSQVKTSEPAPELDPVPVADTISSSPGTAGTPISGDSAGAVIDVLAAYTPAIQAVYGAQGAEALIIQAVAEANQAYTNSKMSTRLNLVRSVLTNYAESGDMNTDLSRLRSTSDGYMDELHALRNSYGADVVSLIENAPQYCGLAYRMSTLSASFASSAFSIVHHSCATGYYSFAHEIGHNQGAHHDATNASGAIFPYAYGYQDPFGRFRSILAYDCPGGCPRVALFSSGDNPLYGVPTGDANVASNATAIDQTAATVAAFRQLGTPPPAAPSDLYGSEIGSSSLRLNWTDRSSDESGFVLERSFDGVSFTQIASLPANTNSYVDTNLQATTLYNYRARAWNSTAYSGYSNVLVAVTEAVSNLPISPAPTAKFELKVNGYKVKGLQKADLSWSGSLSQTVDIYRDGLKLRSAVANTGKYLDNINRKTSATYAYKICEAGNNTCSNSAVVSF